MTGYPPTGAGGGGEGNSRGCDALAGGRGSGAGRLSAGGGRRPAGAERRGRVPGRCATVAEHRSRVGDELPRRLERLGPLPIDDMFCGQPSTSVGIIVLSYLAAISVTAKKVTMVGR